MYHTRNIHLSIHGAGNFRDHMKRESDMHLVRRKIYILLTLICLCVGVVAVASFVSIRILIFYSGIFSGFRDMFGHI